MDLDRLDITLKDLGQPAYRGKQIKLAVYRDLAQGYDDIPTIPRPLRQELAARMSFDELRLETSRRSADGATKNLFLTQDGLAIESVLIPHESAAVPSASPLRQAARSAVRSAPRGTWASSAR